MVQFTLIIGIWSEKKEKKYIYIFFPLPFHCVIAWYIPGNHTEGSYTGNANPESPTLNWFPKACIWMKCFIGLKAFNGEASYYVHHKVECRGVFTMPCFLFPVMSWKTFGSLGSIGHVFSSFVSKWDRLIYSFPALVASMSSNYS